MITRIWISLYFFSGLKLKKLVFQLKTILERAISHNFKILVVSYCCSYQIKGEINCMVNNQKSGEFLSEYSPEM